VARRDEREEREAQDRGDHVVRVFADREGDQPDAHEVQAGREDGRPERPRCAAGGLGGQRGDDEHAVGGEEESRHDRGRVEDMARHVVEHAQAREVQLPPERIGGREHRGEHAGGEDGDGCEGEVMDAVAYRGPGLRSDSHSACAACGEADFGCGEGGQGTLVLWLRRSPRHCPPALPAEIVALLGQESPDERHAARRQW
jgi:hypothetical protein